MSQIEPLQSNNNSKQYLYQYHHVPITTATNTSTIVVDEGSSNSTSSRRLILCKTVRATLLYTLEKGLPGFWNNELKEAWTVVYRILSTTMINAGEDNQQKVREEGKQMLEKTTI